MRVKDAVGRFGEQLAVDFLTGGGLVVVERNWRCSDGEIDVIAWDGLVLVIIEVKTRSSTAFGDPAEAVGRAKAARLRRLASRWLAELREDGGIDVWPEVRFDVVAVVRQGRGAPVLHHLKAAF